MTRKQRLQGMLWFVGVVGFLALIFTITFFLTSWIYERIGQAPPAVVIQLVNSLGGLVITGLIIAALSRIFRSRQIIGEMRIYGPIIEALERIAKGDFSVRVSSTFDRQTQDRSIIGELVNSVNNMALELNQMETMRQEFISNVSHEIQSPLTSIRGFAQALQNDQLSYEDRCHYLTIIETESTRLSKLTDNLLKLASLESEETKFEPKPYRLDKQIRNLVLACEPQWLGKAIEMDISLEEVTIIADEDLLSQVWINLIHNSIKFTPQGGRVGVELHRQGNRIDLEITDTGIGIADDDQIHIFERFFKADKSRERAKEGSGLGLSIAKKIVEMHHGTIGLKTKLGAGTCFTVSLPIAQ